MKMKMKMRLEGVVPNESEVDELVAGVPGLMTLVCEETWLEEPVDGWMGGLPGESGRVDLPIECWEAERSIASDTRADDLNTSR